ncbi:MAG: HU family DNA-binding protein [Actinomycetota bacterium]|nr:HU family DNA-binding protein [Actinomycetota bacterium]
MNRTELAESVSSKTGLDKKQSEAAVEAVTAAIVAEIKAGNRVSIFGFGSFEPRARAARTARNPQTQATVRVPASKSVAFKPASAFKATLNPRGKAAAKKASAAKATAKKAPAKKAPAKKAAPARAVKATKVAKTVRATKATKATKKR